MAYFRNNLISRAGYGGVSGWTDTVGEIGKGALSLFGAQQRAAGAQDVLTQQNRDLVAAQAAGSGGGGISTTALLVGAGVVGLAAFVLLRKKKGS